MAKKRKRTTGTRSKRRRKSLSDFPLAKRGRKKSTRRRRKKGMLSELVSHEGLKKAGKSAAGGGIGGVISGIIGLVAGDKPGLKLALNLGGALVMGAAFDMPNVSAGMAGAVSHDLTTKLGSKLLGEMEREEFADEDSLDEYPDALDENGTGMYLAEDGNFYYLEDFELADDGNYYLSETMQAELYPSYIQTALMP